MPVAIEPEGGEEPHGWDGAEVNQAFEAYDAAMRAAVAREVILRKLAAVFRGPGRSADPTEKAYAKPGMARMGTTFQLDPMGEDEGSFTRVGARALVSAHKGVSADGDRIDSFSVSTRDMTNVSIQAFILPNGSVQVEVFGGAELED
jgi:hypothetical protein